jgi:hypothetical protein
MDFQGQTFIVAVHIEHPFVFFDCDRILAGCAYAAQHGSSIPCGARVMRSEPTYCTASTSASPDAIGRRKMYHKGNSTGPRRAESKADTGDSNFGHDCSNQKIPVGLSSSTPPDQLPEWACGKFGDGQGIGKYRLGKTNGGCEPTDKYYPFCGITIDIMDRACEILNCKLEFYIANEDPHRKSSTAGTDLPFSQYPMLECECTDVVAASCARLGVEGEGALCSWSVAARGHRALGGYCCRCHSDRQVQRPRCTLHDSLLPDWVSAGGTQENGRR